MLYYLGISVRYIICKKNTYVPVISLNLMKLIFVNKKKI